MYSLGNYSSAQREEEDGSVPWTKAQLVALEQGLFAHGWSGESAVLVHGSSNTLSDARTVEEVGAVCEWLVTASLAHSQDAALAKAPAGERGEAVQSGAGSDLFLFAPQQMSARLWHYLQAGAAPSPSAAAPETGAEGTSVEELAKSSLRGWGLRAEPAGVQAPVLTAQLVDLRRLRVAADAARGAGRPLGAPSAPARAPRPTFSANPAFAKSAHSGKPAAVDGLAADAAAPENAPCAPPPARAWGGEEDEALLAGTLRHGFGNWAVACADAALQPAALFGLALTGEAGGADGGGGGGEAAPAAAAAKQSAPVLPVRPSEWQLDPRALSRRAKLLLGCLPALPAVAEAEATPRQRKEGEAFAQRWLASLYPSGAEQGGGGADSGVVVAERAREVQQAKAREREAKNDERARGVVERWLGEFLGKLEKHCKREGRQADKDATEHAREQAERERAASERERARDELQQEHAQLLARLAVVNALLATEHGQPPQTPQPPPQTPQSNGQAGATPPAATPPARKEAAARVRKPAAKAAEKAADKPRAAKSAEKPAVAKSAGKAAAAQPAEKPVAASPKAAKPAAPPGLAVAAGSGEAGGSSETGDAANAERKQRAAQMLAARQAAAAQKAEQKVEQKAQAAQLAAQLKAQHKAQLKAQQKTQPKAQLPVAAGMNAQYEAQRAAAASQYAHAAAHAAAQNTFNYYAAARQAVAVAGMNVQYEAHRVAASSQAAPQMATPSGAVFLLAQREAAQNAAAEQAAFHARAQAEACSSQPEQHPPPPS
ncbi:hypothetical protein T492DRAFT_1146148 [Pavlovales sp. CCMP2436]|nr:hypothetical protein T492DRAFT_1146148 [Pavlovales sp. CCMP2436]